VARVPKRLALGASMTYKGHTILREPYLSRSVYHSRCPFLYGNASPSITFSTSFADAKAEVERHLRGTYTLASRNYSGTLPCCVGGYEEPGSRASLDAFLETLLAPAPGIGA